MKNVNYQIGTGKHNHGEILRIVDGIHYSRYNKNTNNWDKFDGVEYYDPDGIFFYEVDDISEKDAMMLIELL